jgi:hypothetical protein
MFMYSKTILTEDGWDEAAPDCKSKDKEFRKALSTYEEVDEEEYDDQCKTLAKIATLAGTLKAANEVKGDKDAVKYLTDVTNAAKAKQSEVAKAKAEAETAKALALKKAGQDAKKREQEEEDEDQKGDSYAKLTAALKTLKLAHKPYYFLACDAKPYGLVLSKKDIRKNPQARKELTQMAGGSTRPPKVGECHFDGGKYVLEMEKPPSGLARILQKWIKDTTGLNVKVMVGTESSDDADETDAGDDADNAVA